MARREGLRTQLSKLTLKNETAFPPLCFFWTLTIALHEFVYLFFLQKPINKWFETIFKIPCPEG